MTHFLLRERMNDPFDILFRDFFNSNSNFNFLSDVNITGNTAIGYGLANASCKFLVVGPTGQSVDTESIGAYIG